MSDDEPLRLYELLPVQFLLYLIFRTVIMVIDMFPFRMAPTLAKPLGWILRKVDRKHVRIAAKNLEKSRGVCPADAIPAFTARIYEHLARSLVEMVMIPGLVRRGELLRHVRLENFASFDRCLRAGKGCIAVIGHLGNWELIGIATMLTGYPLHSLMRPIDNRWIDRYLRRFRSQTGQQMIPRDRALGEMIRVLQRNKILIVQVDQDARKTGVFVNFFGRPASTHRAPATLSLKYNAPIVMANIYRDGATNCCVLSDPIYPDAFRDRPDPVKALTQEYSNRFEDFVRQHPEQWFWVHDRWKTAERVARTTTEALV